MTSVPDIPYHDLLAPEGTVRSLLKAAGWGDWADTFCDGILEKFLEPHLEDVVHLFGRDRLHYVETDTGFFQLNLASQYEEKAWEVHTGATFEAVMKSFLQSYRAKQERNNG